MFSCSRLILAEGKAEHCLHINDMKSDAYEMANRSRYSENKTGPRIEPCSTPHVQARKRRKGFQ